MMEMILLWLISTMSVIVNSAQFPSNSQNSAHDRLSSAEAIHMTLWGGSLVKFTWLNPVQYKPGNLVFSPRCKYGGSGDSLNQTAQGVAYTYAAGMFNQTLNTVIIDLEGNVYDRVYYQCGDPKYGWSPLYSFQLEPPSVNPRQLGNIALIADLGVTNGTDTITALQQFTESGLVKMVVHAGDISYADDFSKHEHNNSYIWVEYMEEIEKFTSSVPYMTAPGNHERQYDFLPYRNWLPMPNKASGSKSPYWYSFDYMGIHFLSFSTEHSFNQSSDQYAFMKEDLMKANKNREKVPWIFVVGHRPLYCTSLVVEHRCVFDAPIFRSYLEDLLYEQKVDVYLCGHDHSYERTYPVYREKAVQTNYRNPKAPIYIVDGEAGSPEPNDPSFQPDVDWRANFYAGWDNGFLLVQPTPVALQFQYIRSRDWAPVDIFSVTKS